MEFNESGLQFKFEEAYWQIIKFDTDVNYKKIANDLSTTKAIDFLGIYRNEFLVMFEIKSFRHYGPQSRLNNGAEELTIEIAQKVRDSVAAIVGAHRNTTHNHLFWTTACTLLTNSKKEIFVIAWVEEDGADMNEMKWGKQRSSLKISKLKQKLKWLTARIMVENVKNCTLSFKGFSCKFIAGS